MEHLEYNQPINHFIIGTKEFNQIFESFPGPVYCKDKEGKYLEVNKVQVFTHGLNFATDLLGKKDDELTDKLYASICVQNDNDVIYTEQPKIAIECIPVLHLENKVKTFLSHKFPLKNKSNKTIGIFGMSSLLDDKETITSWLDNSGFLAKKNEPELDNHELSPRQIDCLFYLARGMTLKMIGKQLSLSPKTVEYYLEIVKTKLSCSTKYELIDKALQFAIIRKRLFPYNLGQPIGFNQR